MGVWGSGSFDNDDALDWVEHLIDTNLETVETALRRAVEGRSIDASVAARAIAAAEVVAALLGQTGSGVPEAVERWVTGRNVALTRATTDSATCALKRIFAEDALAEMWRTSGLLLAWRANMEDLLRRLEMASAGLAPAPDTGSNDPSSPATASAIEEPALARRVQAFLANIEPFDGYAPGSATEDCLQRFVACGPWDDDARSDLRICYSAVLDEIESHDFAAFCDLHRRYLSECAALLREIMLEVLGDAKRIDLG